MLLTTEAVHAFGGPVNTGSALNICVHLRLAVFGIGDKAQKERAPYRGPFSLGLLRSQAMPGLPAIPLIFGVFGCVALMVFLWRMYSATTSQIGLLPTGFCSMLAQPATR